MFGRSIKKAAKSPESLSRKDKDMHPSVIAANMNVLGNIISEGILDIDGQVDGNVRAYMVTVRPNGRIRGDVVADEVFVHGTIDGLIKASSVIIYNSALVTGTVMHESLMVEDGATLEGKLKRMEKVVLEDLSAESAAARRPIVPPVIDSNFMNDNDEPQSEREIKILDSLRLIS